MEGKQGWGWEVSPGRGSKANCLPGASRHVVEALKAMGQEVKQSSGEKGQQGLEAGGEEQELKMVMVAGQEVLRWGSWGLGALKPPPRKPIPKKRGKQRARGSRPGLRAEGCGSRHSVRGSQGGPGLQLRPEVQGGGAVYTFLQGQ